MDKDRNTTDISVVLDRNDNVVSVEVSERVEKELVELAKPVQEEVYHRQPNTQLQSVHLWRQKGLFDLDYNPKNYQRDKTVLLDNWLLKVCNKLWQTRPTDQQGYVKLKIVDISKEMYESERPNHEQYENIKEGLLRLGGYMLPYVRFEEGKLRFSLVQTIEVEFETNITKEEFENTSKDSRLGSQLLAILKEGYGQRITAVRIKPNPKFIEEMRGKGQGYTQLKDSTIRELRGKLTEGGLKWFDYISQNKSDKGGLRLSTVINRFGWQEKLKHEGKPKCRELAIKGFNECVEVNQIYSEQAIRGKREGSYYDEDKEMFVWHRTGDWVRKKMAKIEAEKTTTGDETPDIISKLKRLMDKNEWTVSTMSEKLGVSRAYLSKVLNGKKNCGEELAGKIRGYTG
jgi:antitoxin component HigA of HigAB toxin-antitoxin module